jgi:hypothetical protein
MFLLSFATTITVTPKTVSNNNNNYNNYNNNNNNKKMKHKPGISTASVVAFVGNGPPVAFFGS